MEERAGFGDPRGGGSDGLPDGSVGVVYGNLLAEVFEVPFSGGSIDSDAVGLHRGAKDVFEPGIVDGGVLIEFVDSYWLPHYLLRTASFLYFFKIESDKHI